ncbi:MAG: hypothetical protein K6U74_05500, partial [Firmicutes bacterium]|nr:hypothetical protein [Bacillota bacterium]
GGSEGDGFQGSGVLMGKRTVFQQKLIRDPFNQSPQEIGFLLLTCPEAFSRIGPLPPQPYSILKSPEPRASNRKVAVINSSNFWKNLPAMKI